MRAISRPAAALEMPSQVFALSPPGCASPTTPRTTYGPKTNEVMTAEYAEDPQSHRPHASTTRRLMRDPTARGGSSSAACSTLSPFVIASDLWISPQAAPD